MDVPEMNRRLARVESQVLGLAESVDRLARAVAGLVDDITADADGADPRVLPSGRQSGPATERSHPRSA